MRVALRGGTYRIGIWKRFEKNFKEIWKKCLTKSLRCGIIVKLSAREGRGTANGHWKLNNKRDCTKHCEVRNTRSRQKELYILNKVKEAKIKIARKGCNRRKSDIIKIFREFDPGSGWTLAACITHSSRTESDHLILREAVIRLSGGRVSNAWATCLYVRDNVGKLTLIPHNTLVPHDTDVKDLLHRDGLASD